MIDLGNRRILDNGIVVCGGNALIELLYQGGNLTGVFCDRLEDQKEWQDASRWCDTKWDGPTFIDQSFNDDVDWFDHWSTPDPYRTIDVREWCLARCDNDREISRVNEEIDAFESRNMIRIMQHLIYCVDEWRKHQIVWGVGRGSSVCSFVLYLIGINRINPLDHDLDLHEWLK